MYNLFHGLEEVLALILNLSCPQTALGLSTGLSIQLRDQGKVCLIVGSWVPNLYRFLPANLVGATRFERATSSTPWKRATKLRHAPARF